MKNKKIIITVLILILLVLVAGAVIVLKYSGEDGKRSEIDFSTCSVLKDSCSDKSCDLFYLCNEQEVKSCKIYDCQENYGVEATNGIGVTEKKYHEKFNKEQAEMDIKECGGRLAVIEKGECRDGAEEIIVQVLTGESCDITGFTSKVDGQDKMVQSQKVDDGYKLRINKCGEVTEITAIGEGGVQIKESY